MISKRIFMKILFICFLISFICSTAEGQNSQYWYKIYGTPGLREDGKSIYQTLDGNFILLKTFSINNNDFGNLIKLDEFGNPIWTRLIGGDSTPHNCKDIILTRDSGYVIMGQFLGPFLIKYDNSGNLLWQRNYSGLGSMHLWSARQSRDGGFLICGSNTYYDPPSGKGFLVKTDSLGITIWQREYFDSQFSTLGYLLEDSLNNIYLSGATRELQYGTDKFVAKKLTPSGDIIWSRILYNNFIKSGDRIYAINQKNLIFLALNDWVQPYIIRIDSSGNISSIKDITNIISWVSYSCFDNKKNFVFIDYHSDISGYSWGGITKIDTSGNIIIPKKIFTTQGYYTWIWPGICNVTFENDFVITGNMEKSFYPNPGEEVDYFVMKIDSNLNIPVVININENHNEIVTDFHLSQNYPNPFNSETKIEFSIPKDGNVNLEIYNIIGKLVYSYNKKYNQGNNTIRINFDNLNLSTGLYLIKLNYKNSFKVIKSILLK